MARIGPVGAGAIAAAMCLAVVEGPTLLGAKAPLGALERRSLDLRFTLRGPEAITEPIVVVTIDDESLRRRGDQLSRRRGFADLVVALRAAGAKVIAIDAFFSDEERVLPAPLVDDIVGYLAAVDAGREALSPTARALFSRVLDEEDGDEALARALSDDVVLAVHSGETAGFTDARADLTKAAWGQQVPGPSMPYAARRLLASLPMFHERAGRVGVATIVVDPADQTARALHMGRTFHGRILAPFSVQIAAAAKDVPRARLAFDASTHTIHLGERAFALGADHTLLINHRGGADVFRTVSAADVLDGAAADVLRGAIAIIGYTELGQDKVRTPFSTHLPGAALHANVVSNLLRGDPLQRTSRAVDVLLVVFCGFVGAMAFHPRLPLKALPRVVAVVSVAVAWLVGAQFLFVGLRLWVPVVAPLVTLGVAALSGLTVAFGAEGVARARLRRTFAHYLSDDVIDELLENPSALTLGGSRRELTVLFSDICGFTTLSEELEPLALVRFLNTYFTPMTKAVLENRGLLDKYIGDAVMAVFGAPVPRADHADLALSCVLAMYERLPDVRRAVGRDIEIGIGVNTGEMVVGNMGSAERFDYTVAGDAVNLASRIEGLTRTYGVFCLVGENTRARASARFRFRAVDLVRVKGKRQPAEIFEFLGDDRVTLASRAALDRWDEGLAAYRAGRFDDARRAFRAFHDANPHDRAVVVLLERMDALGTAPPTWDGVIEQKSK